MGIVLSVLNMDSVEVGDLVIMDLSTQRTHKYAGQSLTQHQILGRSRVSAASRVMLEFDTKTGALGFKPCPPIK